MRFETTQVIPANPGRRIGAKADGIISGPLVAAYETHRKASIRSVAQSQCHT